MKQRTPEQVENGKRLIAALREMPEGKGVYLVPGDGEMIWDFREFLFPANPYFNETNELPEEFCGSVGCALGLAALMGIVEKPNPHQVAEALGITISEAIDLFTDNAVHYFKEDEHGEEVAIDFSFITPAMVAGALEGVLSGHQ